MTRFLLPQLSSLAALPLALCCLIAPSAGARPAIAPAAPVVKFSCLLWDGAIPAPLFYRDGDSFHPLSVFQNSRSKEHALFQSNGLGIYIKIDGPVEEGQLPYKRIAQSRLLEGTKQILFLLFRVDTAEGPGFRVVPLDDSTDAFPAGTFRFANFTPETLHVKFADRLKKLPPGELTDMKSDVKARGGLIPFLIGDARGDRIFETRLFAQPTGREMVFIGPPKARGGLPSVRFLPQLLPQELPTPKPPPPE